MDCVFVVCRRDIERLSKLWQFQRLHFWGFGARGLGTLAAKKQSLVLKL